VAKPDWPVSVVGAPTPWRAPAGRRRGRRH